MAQSLFGSKRQAEITLEDKLAAVPLELGKPSFAPTSPLPSGPPINASNESIVDYSNLSNTLY
jgi:hypothetical protein